MADQVHDVSRVNVELAASKKCFCFQLQGKSLFKGDVFASKVPSQDVPEFAAPENGRRPVWLTLKQTLCSGGMFAR